jgi:hypothetical protein
MAPMPPMIQLAKVGRLSRKRAKALKIKRTPFFA